ncbi:hypothetical protein P152DRAFT_329947 [Eremomyces bilateralis CBS 781.70]|uniref:Uncharacterized protein n=1 Tax=Eremomyces bilateralis CBS 781.70 TaxID=1392243 RepID=A0A6G1G4Y0_9PEZI|nr:uncharacterized protein P152DRAFT_329947 [Eremomyces bilateralis CBS 781.70]KAF1812889.1 hypothetical protein P152DRAFT_329947 [Eremomyces bilateralis CBS 781.70]
MAVAIDEPVNFGEAWETARADISIIPIDGELPSPRFVEFALWVAFILQHPPVDAYVYRGGDYILNASWVVQILRNNWSQLHYGVGNRKRSTIDSLREYVSNPLGRLVELGRLEETVVRLLGTTDTTLCTKWHGHFGHYPACAEVDSGIHPEVLPLTGTVQCTNNCGRSLCYSCVGRSAAVKDLEFPPWLATV